MTALGLTLGRSAKVAPPSSRQSPRRCLLLNYKCCVHTLLLFQILVLPVWVESTMSGVWQQCESHAPAPARNLARCLGHEGINTIQWMSHTFMSQQSSNSLIVWCQWLTDLKAVNLMKVRHIYYGHVLNVSSPRPQLCVGISLQSGAGWPCVTSDPAVWLWLSHTGDWWRQP